MCVKLTATKQWAGLYFLKSAILFLTFRTKTFWTESKQSGITEFKRFLKTFLSDC